MNDQDLVSVSVKLHRGDLDFLFELTKTIPGKKQAGDLIRDAVKEYIDKKRRS